MCFHPVKIRNPSLFINPDIDKPYIEVPCGHCEQCKKNRVNDLVVRAYYEWKHVVSLGGWSYFDTLTYRPESVPKIFGTMCFSRTHLTKFFKCLRITLQRKGYQLQDKQGNSLLKYLVTTEYGEDERFTKRPHYHILWFVAIPNLTVLQFYHIVRDIWTYKYKFGWNDKITDVMGHVVNRLDGIRYVCKYLTKSCDYQSRLRNLIDAHKDNPDEIQFILSNIKNIKPFYRASLGFGASILDLDYNQLSQHGVPIYSSKGIEFTSIPKYIRYKVHYDKVQHPYDDSKTLLKRNAKGVDYLINHIDEVIEAKTLQYQNLLDNENIYTDEDYHLNEYVKSILGNRSIRDFVIYKHIYKGHLFSDLSFSDYKDYFTNWLSSPKLLPNPCRRKKLLDKYLSTREHAIIDDRSLIQFERFDDIDAVFDDLFDRYNFYLETNLKRKHNEEERCHEVYTRFCRNM